MLFSLTYAYDAVGNRTRATVNGVQSNYFHDQNDRMYFEGANSVPFDANGNMLGLPSKGATYAYDPEDRLTRATHTAGAIVDYAYDGEGARIETKVTQGATFSTTRHLVDKNRAYAEVIEERDGAGDLTAIYTHGHDLEGPVSQERFSGGTGTVSYYLTDHLGSTRFLVDATGNVTDSYHYEPYGTVSQRTGTTANSYQFTGEQFDQATGMTYLRARWLANGVGRFITTDTFAGIPRRPATLNDYTYAHSNPVRFIDPTGFIALVAIGDSSVSAAAFQATAANTARVAANNIAGKAFEKFIGIHLQNFVNQNAGATLLRQVYFKGPGGKRFADFVVKVGDKFVAIEVKTKIPLNGGTLVRLGNQMKSFVLGNSPKLTGTAAEVIVVTEETVAALEASFIAVESQIATGTLSGVLQGTSGLMTALRAILLGI